MNATEFDARETQPSKAITNAESHQLFLNELADIYDGEKQLIKFLPRMAKAAQSPELREAFEDHFLETLNHVILIEATARSLDEPLASKTFTAMQSLLQEALQLMENEKDFSALDAVLIAAARKVEQYEIATYGRLLAWADQMGLEEVAGLLDEIFCDEKRADERLAQLDNTLSRNEKLQQPNFDSITLKYESHSLIRSLNAPLES